MIEDIEKFRAKLEMKSYTNTKLIKHECSELREINKVYFPSKIQISSHSNYWILWKQTTINLRDGEKYKWHLIDYIYFCSYCGQKFDIPGGKA